MNLKKKKKKKSCNVQKYKNLNFAYTNKIKLPNYYYFKKNSSYFYGYTQINKIKITQPADY